MNFEKLHILRHSIGLDDNGHGRQYRNNYCVGLDFPNPSLDAITELVKDGLMKPGPKINDGRDQYFFATNAGIKEATKGVEPIRLTKAQRRYQAYLHSDCGLKFGEWLKGQHAKEVI